MSGAAAGDAAATSPYLWSLGLRVEHVVPERVVVRVPYRDDNANAGGVLHGGVIASAVDAAGVLLARAGAEVQPEAEPGTLDLTVGYLAPAVGEDLVAEARLRRRGREIVHADVDVRTAGGKPVATATLTHRFAPPGARARSWSEAMPAAPPSSSRSPLEALLATSPFIVRLGVRVLYADDGVARATLPPLDANRDADGQVHEGALIALLDIAGALASWSLVPLDPRVRFSTVGIHVGLHAPARGEVAAEARVLHRRSEIVASRVTLGVGGQTVATGAATYRLVAPQA